MKKRYFMVLTIFALSTFTLFGCGTNYEKENYNSLYRIERQTKEIKELLESASLNSTNAKSEEIKDTSETKTEVETNSNSETVVQGKEAEEIEKNLINMMFYPDPSGKLFKVKNEVFFYPDASCSEESAFLPKDYIFSGKNCISFQNSDGQTVYVLYSNNGLVFTRRNLHSSDFTEVE